MTYLVLLVRESQFICKFYSNNHSLGDIQCALDTEAVEFARILVLSTYCANPLVSVQKDASVVIISNQIEIKQK